MAVYRRMWDATNEDLTQCTEMWATVGPRLLDPKCPVGSLASNWSQYPSHHSESRKPETGPNCLDNTRELVVDQSSQTAISASASDIEQSSKWGWKEQPALNAWLFPLISYASVLSSSHSTVTHSCTDIPCCPCTGIAHQGVQLLDFILQPPQVLHKIWNRANPCLNRAFCRGTKTMLHLRARFKHI